MSPALASSLEKVAARLRIVTLQQRYVTKVGQRRGHVLPLAQPPRHLQPAVESLPRGREVPGQASQCACFVESFDLGLRKRMGVDADLCDRIRRIFWHKLNLEVSSIDVDLIDTGVLDSLHLVDLLLHLEREFQTSVSLEDLEIDNFRTIEDIASFIADKKAWVGNGSGYPDLLESEHKEL